MQERIKVRIGKNRRKMNGRDEIEVFKHFSDCKPLACLGQVTSESIIIVAALLYLMEYVDKFDKRHDF